MMGGSYLCRLCKLTCTIIIASILSLSAVGYCQITSPNSRYLLVAPDARGKALANGGSVFSKGAVSAYYNPALLVTTDEFSAEINYHKYLPLLSDYSLKNLFLSLNFDDHAYFGIGITTFKHEIGRWIFDGYDEWIEWIDLHDYSLAMWSAFSFDPHNSVGAGIKYIKTNRGYAYRSGKDKASSMAFDFGFLSRNHLPHTTWKNDEVFYPGLNRRFKVERDKGFTFGISFANLGRDFEFDEYAYSESLPRLLRVAAGYQAVDSEPVGLRLTVDAAKLLINIDDSFKEEWSEVAWSYGLEATFYYILDFRLGRLLDRGDHLRYTTIGIGLGPEWLGIDYSYVLEGDEYWNRSGGEYSISFRCNVTP